MKPALKTPSTLYSIKSQGSTRAPAGAFTSVFRPHRQFVAAWVAKVKALAARKVMVRTDKFTSSVDDTLARGVQIVGVENDQGGHARPIGVDAARLTLFEPV